MAKNPNSPVRYRLSDEDRAKFGGPEWVTFRRPDLFSLPASDLMKLESEMNLPIGNFLVNAMQGSVLGTKCMIWLARRLDGGMKEKFAEFDPHIFQCESEIVEEESEEPDPTRASSSGSETQG
jgi:hypothetical protein